MEKIKFFVILLLGILLGMIIYHVLEANKCQIKCEDFMIEQQCICVYDNGYERFNNSIKYNTLKYIEEICNKNV